MTTANAEVLQQRINNLSRLCTEQASLIRQYEIVLQNSLRSLAAEGKRIKKIRERVAATMAWLSSSRAISEPQISVSGV
ncbi:MAG: hypothetical protein DELT_00528 [Desulfovibrio sp.]